MTLPDKKPAFPIRLRGWLRQLASLPAPPECDYPFARSDIAMLATLEGGSALIDAQTWDEMLLDAYSASLAEQTSIFGQQRLHQRLAGGTADPASAERVRALLDAPDAMLRLQQAMHGLRSVDMEVSAPLFGQPIASPPWWRRLLPLPPLALLLSLAAALLFAPLAWFGVLAAWAILMVVQVQFHERCKHWQRSVRSLQQLLLAHERLGALDTPFTQGWQAEARQSGRLHRQLVPMRWLKLIPLLSEYEDWFVLGDVRRYFRSRLVLLRQRDFFRASFLRVADLEADLALARHLRASGQFCWAQAAPGDALHLRLEQVRHPLLPAALPLSLNLDGRGAFVSGQNGIGKSTLLRTLGLNLVCARAFGFCHAQSAHVPLLPLYSSMQSEDSLAGGESLYLAELRRARELLALADGAEPALFIIDEIFRGTNHLESISAAAAVLHTLAARHLVIVSSHNLVLAPLLEDCLAPWCVRRGAGAGLLLAPGVLQATNGIALLAERGFGSAIEDKAGRVFGWLSSHMAQPADCSGVLHEASGDENVLTL
ncbi:MutS-related protein [Janthinobacterium psychrotolerans]|uniref:MutS domain V n=1 Tax=Janthinobacterium psychrotolerans TaxID=1747903 RepID=A0A1A7BUE4_9BURK|nr:DNA mismatch repair protein MutS [Janthinobacterium psychrotolerans]OBV37181.1 MutS domain V [Janthinobacterium psychrotolerans]